MTEPKLWAGPGPARAARVLLLATLLAAATPGLGLGADVEFELADRTGVQPIVFVPAHLPIPLGPIPGEVLGATPTDLGTDVLYGVLQRGSLDGALTIAVYRQPDGRETVILDLNDNEDLTDDKRLTWSGTYGPLAGGQPVLPSLRATIRIPCGPGAPPLDLEVEFKRYEKERASGQAAVGITNGIVAVIDSYREGTLTLGARTVKAALVPVNLAAAGSPFAQPGTALVIDVNGDGRLDGHPFRAGERFRLGAPFIIGDQGYQVKETSCDGRRVVLTLIDPKSVPVPARSRSMGMGGPEPGDRAPEFSLATIDGDTIHLSAYRGKVVLLDFWATWCLPCRAELPYVKRAFESYHRRGLEIIGVSLDNKPTEVRAFTRMSGMPWPQILQGRGTTTPLKESYGIQSIPAAFLIDREGFIAAAHPRGEGLLRALEDLFAAEGG